MSDRFIERAHYVALNVEDPAAAADFAVEKMGFARAFTDDSGTEYLKASGRDPYSLVYKSGEPGIDHVSYLVKDDDALDRAHKTVESIGATVSATADSKMWMHAPGFQVESPNGHTFDFTTGVNVEIPMAAATGDSGRVPGPVCLDHVVTKGPKPEQEREFAENCLGLIESATISAPDVGGVLSFYRSKVLFHCLAIARSKVVGLHHMQFTLPSPLALDAAYQSLHDDEDVRVIWGPVRHGPGHNLAFYFFDGAGNFVEYSAEEEIILNDSTYEPRQWSVAEQKSMDEWGTRPPDYFFD